MAVQNVFRDLTVFDILGNFIPGVIVLISVVLILPRETAESISTSSTNTQLILAIVAFSLGHILQQHASVAAGKRETFKNTLISARTGGYEPSTDFSDYTIRRKVIYIPYYAYNIAISQNIKHWFDYSIIGRLSLLPARLYRSIFEPILLIRIKKDEPLDDNRLASKVWKICKKKYVLSDRYDNYGDLLHLMSSDLESHGSSRALRFQAIRNFQRGMWIACFYSTVLFSISLYTAFLPWTPVFEDIWTPAWTLILISLFSSYSFYELKEKYEEEFIEYLFTDYVTMGYEEIKRER